MQSPVNWALLGLVIDRPSYAQTLRVSHPGFDGDFDASVRLAKGEVSADAQSEEVPRGDA
jgi:hypothetical protein